VSVNQIYSQQVEILTLQNSCNGIGDFLADIADPYNIIDGILPV